MKNPVRSALLDRRVTLGSWIQIGHPAIAEMLSSVGYEWIAVDCEHTDISVAGFSALARSIEGRGVVPLARVRENDTLSIRQALDAGSMGVIVPLVNNAKEASQAVAAAKYPPSGIRGFAFCRANDYGVSFDEYVSRANDEIAVIVMIETKAAVENIYEILAVEGVDGILVGPYDLSGSYGIPGDTDNPIITEALESIGRACEETGKSAGVHIVTPQKESIAAAIASGFTFLAIGMDTVFLDSASRSAFARASEIACPRE